jgi:cation transport ATPase
MLYRALVSRVLHQVSASTAAVFFCIWESLVIGVDICLGSRQFLESQGYAVPVAEDYESVAPASAPASSADAIMTFVWVGWGHLIRGRIALSDVVRSDAADIISWLHAQGIDVWMVTGDNESAAHAVAAAVEIPRDRVIAHAAPSRKLQAVQV